MHEEKKAAEAAHQEDPAGDARRWLLSTPSGVFGTLSTDASSVGYPFLSVTPFALDERGHLLFQIAEIAVHTRNVKADARASLLVQQPGVEGDPQSGWRLTVLGKVQPVA